MVKYVLKEPGQEVKETCGTEQLCGGVVSVNEGGIHAMCLFV